MGALRMGAEEFSRQLTDSLNRVGNGGDEVIVERNGRPIAVLKPYVASEAAPEHTRDDVEQVPILAAQLEAAREAAGVSYEELALQLQTERLHTLQEKYPDFIAEFDPDAGCEPT